MNADYEIALATPDDIPGIIALQEPNAPDNGGSLAVRRTAEWFKHAMLEMPIIVARRDGRIIGYLVSTSLAAKSDVGIIQAMLRRFSAPPNCYLYGPVCISKTERGKGLARILYEELRARLPDRTGLTFVRADNSSSLRAHRKMGMQELGMFTNEGTDYVAFGYDASY